MESPETHKIVEFFLHTFVLYLSNLMVGTILFLFNNNPVEGFKTDNNKTEILGT